MTKLENGGRHILWIDPNAAFYVSYEFINLRIFEDSNSATVLLIHRTQSRCRLTR